MRMTEGNALRGRRNPSTFDVAQENSSAKKGHHGTDVWGGHLIDT